MKMLKLERRKLTTLDKIVITCLLTASAISLILELVILGIQGYTPPPIIEVLV